MCLSFSFFLVLAFPFLDVDRLAVSAIKGVKRDSQNPKLLIIIFAHKPKDVDGMAEFTTEEAAVEWTRELEGSPYHNYCR